MIRSPEAAERLPEADGQVLLQSNGHPYNMAMLKHMQRRHGNQAVQRTLKKVQREGPLTEDTEIPGVAGSNEVSFVGDILTVLDTGLTITDIAAGAAGAAFTESVGFAALAGGVGVLGALAFAIGGVFALAQANMAGERWASVQGTSYAIVSLAHGRPAPAAPGWMGAGEAFTSAAQATQEGLQTRAQRSRVQAARIAGALLGLRRQNPQTALNQIYQQLVDQHLQSSFLGISFRGGVLYNMARGYYLHWPEVGGHVISNPE